MSQLESNREILVVDDEDINLDILTEILKSRKELSHFVFTSFTDPTKALTYAQGRDNIEVILLDQHMPQLSGVKFIEQYNNTISADERSPFIMISSDDSDETMQKAFNLGIDDYFSKPFNQNIITSRIINCLEKNRLRNSVRESKRQKELLLRVLVHDINSSLSAAISSVKILKLEPTEVWFDHLSKALKSISDLTRLIRKLEAHDANKTKIPLQPVAIAPLVREIINLHILQTKEKGVTVNFINETGEDSLVPSNDEILRLQIIPNLLTNALKFSPRNGKIDITLKNCSTGLCLSIQDQGVGIPDDTLKTLFKWGKKDSRNGTSGEAGTGFGMPIVKRFLDELNHRIEVESTSEGPNIAKSGTVFKIFFDQMP